MIVFMLIFHNLGGYNEYVNYSWDDYDKESGYMRPKPRLTRATSSRDSGLVVRSS